MTSSESELLAPKSLILPIMQVTPGATRITGETFISGGQLCFVSGANVVMLSGGTILA